MSFEVEGKLHKVFPAEQKSQSFKTREFVIEIAGQYPQYVKFQLTQDRCDVIDPYQPGQQVKVYFELRGREWQDKFFTNLQAWRVEALGDKQAAPMPNRKEVSSANGGSRSSEPERSMDDFDDLPF